MITVEEAEKIIQSKVKNFGIENIPFDDALGRVLAADITADRDLPPFNRVTMDGIAISFDALENGIHSFKIIATQAAGYTTIDINDPGECIEIMTGAALPATTDTVIRYEDTIIENGIATITTPSVTKGQSIHLKGKDKKQHEVVAFANELITPAIIGIAASVGRKTLAVKKLPRVIIISSGDELVEVNEKPSPFQIRRSNNYMIKAVLQQYCLHADMQHLPDDLEKTKKLIVKCLETYDVIIVSGGISMGKFDHLPQALASVSVTKLFHKVQQKPGKPFWFGVDKNDSLVFAFPGNPVSTFMCLHRYFLPWLCASAGLLIDKEHAILSEDFSFMPNLVYFLQVKLTKEKGKILATPVEGNGSGDFSNLLQTQAFMELPAEQNNFAKGEIFRIWPY
ncbi:MAG: molybdopterin molybdotransferase MoeA [Ginsengibacter sp.]